MSSSALTLTSRSALLISIVLLLLPIAYIEYQVLDYTGGTWAYPLDDTYIHMGIAKNLAFHQVWGSTPYGFASASSSILYPFLLAGLYRLFGVQLMIPFLVNLLAGIGVLIVAQQWLKRRQVEPFYQLVILTALIFLTPLPIIVIIGMEHTLQILVSMLFIFECCDWLSAEKNKDKVWPLFIYGILVTSVRFEGMFLIMVACLFLLAKRRWMIALGLGVVSALPILLFGLYSIHKGSYFLPNSVLLKSSTIPQNLSEVPDFITSGLCKKLYYSPATAGQVATEWLLLLLPIAYFLFYRLVKEVTVFRYLLVFLMTATLLHLIFASTVWFYRYEAYLIFCTILAVGAMAACSKDYPIIREAVLTRWVAGGFLVFLCLPIVMRAMEAFHETADACHDIYNQNYQMGLFLHRYYDSTVIAINDLGAVSYLTDGKNLDMWGLANIDVARSKREHRYSQDFLDNMVRKEKVKIAVVFDRLYTPGLLHKWKKVATWHIDQLTVSGDANLNFYAVDTLLAPDLKKKLMTYQTHLPPEVRVAYY